MIRHKHSFAIAAVVLLSLLTLLLMDRPGPEKTGPAQDPQPVVEQPQQDAAIVPDVGASVIPHLRTEVGEVEAPPTGPAPARLSGTLVDHNGQPLHGIELQFSKLGERATVVRTDSTGSFSDVLVAEGTYRISPEPPALGLLPSSVSCEAGEVVQLDLSCTMPIAEIHGIVVDASRGGPVPKATIGGSGFAISVRSKSDGTFVVWRYPGDLELSNAEATDLEVVAPGYLPFSSNEPVRWGTRGYNVHLAGGCSIVLEVVRQETGELLRPKIVRVIPLKPGLSQRLLKDGDPELGEDRCTISGLTAGLYSVLVAGSHPDGGSWFTGVREVAVEDRKQLVLRVERGLQTKVLVTDGVNGPPLHGARVQVVDFLEGSVPLSPIRVKAITESGSLGEAVETEVAVSDAKGECAVQCLPGHSLYVTMDGYQPQLVQIQGRDQVVVSLIPGTSLVGQVPQSLVAFIRGYGGTGLRVTAVPMGPKSTLTWHARKSITIDAQGHFRTTLDPVAHRFFLEWKEPSHVGGRVELGSMSAEEVVGGEARFASSPPPYALIECHLTVDGVVAADRGLNVRQARPAADAPPTASQIKFADGLKVRTLTLWATDAQGVFRAALSTGSWQLSLSDDPDRSATLEVPSGGALVRLPLGLDLR